MDGYSKADRVYRVFQSISSGYDDANNRISLGMQKKWKKMLTDLLIRDLPKDACFLDVCCGTGDIALCVAKARPDVKVIGIDFSPAMLRVAAAKRAGLKNVRFIKEDAMKLSFKDNQFAAVCISFGLRNTENYEKVLCEMRRVVKPGGLIGCLDSFVPDSRLIQPFYQIYFHYLMPLLGSRKNRKEYMWLYESTQMFLHRRELEDLYKKVGIRKVQHKTRMFGACVLVYGQK